MRLFSILIIMLFCAKFAYSTEVLLDTGIGLNRVSGIGVSGNSANVFSCMLGSRAKLYTSGSGKYFFAPGLRAGYSVKNRAFTSASLSLRSDGNVYEQWSLVSLDSVLEFGRKFNKYEISALATFGLGSVFYDGVVSPYNPQLSRTRDTGLGVSAGITNGLAITERLTARLEIAYRWYYLIAPSNPGMFNTMLVLQCAL
jgi:hypothetical protein